MCAGVHLGAEYKGRYQCFSREDYPTSVLEVDHIVVVRVTGVSKLGQGSTSTGRSRMG